MSAAEACREQGTPEPTVESDGNGVRIQWAWVNPLSDADRIRARVEGVEGRVQVGDQVTDLVGDSVTDPVGDPVDRLLQALDGGPLATSRLQTVLGLKHRPTFKENYLKPALAEGLIEMTVPDKPSSRLQRYRLTEAGKARLAAKRGGAR